jgi:hypothetical protein
MVLTYADARDELRRSLSHNNNNNVLTYADARDVLPGSLCGSLPFFRRV